MSSKEQIPSRDKPVTFLTAESYFSDYIAGVVDVQSAQDVYRDAILHAHGQAERGHTVGIDLLQSPAIVAKIVALGINPNTRESFNAPEDRERYIDQAFEQNEVKRNDARRIYDSLLQTGLFSSDIVIPPSL